MPPATGSPCVAGPSIAATSKVSASSGTSIRRSQRLEGSQSASPSPVKDTEHSMRKKPSSPVRRSERIQKLPPPSSSGSKILKKKAKKKASQLASERATTVVISEEARNLKNDVTNDKKRKRLDARSYRALFRPAVQKAKTSEEVNDASEGVAYCLAVHGPMEDRKNETSVQEASSPDANSYSDSQKSKFAELMTGSPGEQSSGNCLRSQSGGNDCYKTSQGQSDLPLPQDRGGIELDSSIDVTDKKDNTIEMQEYHPSVQVKRNCNVCVICRCPGILLVCDGKDCKRCYHLSCVDPPLNEAPPGIWHCLCCVRKKIESGIYSVSEGIESILDVQVVQASDDNEMQEEKQYFVKYRGLAHVHNRWIPEKQLLCEEPDLVSQFNKNCHDGNLMIWKKEWTIPQRLLQKRLIMPLSLADDCFIGCESGTSHCYYEWFVKWTGLGYEHATWEFENSDFLMSSEAKMLIMDYENRRREAFEASTPSRAEKAQQIKTNPLKKQLLLPYGSSLDLDGSYLSYVNKLREHWHRSEGTILANDQDRIIKVILFISTLISDVCRPLLIISSSDSLLLWESEFMHVSSSINVVTYCGSKETRKQIRDLEFYDEGGCILFKVLLSLPDAVLEDFNSLDCFGWETVIVDDCQLSEVSECLQKLKDLTADWRLLLSNGQLKDCIAEYINVLSFINCGTNQNSLVSFMPNSDDPIAELAALKELFGKFNVNSCRQDKLLVHVNDCESVPSKFLEFWVPVKLSNVQLEQYCACLISASTVLRSCTRFEHLEAARDILLSLRKCCDHPYLVDGSLQASLVKDLPPAEYLDVGVQASGKLMLLDKILQGMQSEGLRTVILFHFIGGDVKISIGDILDDFLRQRFGADSYERVDSGLSSSKKQAALQMFNNKESGRFIFLIEYRACSASIKLSSVDAIIVFGSDWNPLNDIKLLQRISFDSQFERIKVFRLYSFRTVEEKALSFAKQDVTLDSNISNISRSICNSLLSCGASHQFDKLDEFHRNNDLLSAETKALCEEPSMNDSVLEILTQMSNSVERIGANNFSVMSKARLSGATYSTTISLFGDNEMKAADEEPPQHFWPKLLDGRYPHWRYVTGSSQRVRRKAQLFSVQQEQPRGENDDGKRKRKKGSGTGITANATTDSFSCQPSLLDKRKEVSSGTLSSTDGSHLNCNVQDSLTCHSSKKDEANYVSFERGGKLRSIQKNLYLMLKPELARLCEVLMFPDYVKRVAVTFLQYIMKNHHVNQEHATVLQALKISLCWRAASFTKYTVDHIESLEHAKKCLNFECKLSEAESVYLKLQILKEKFPCTSAVDTENNLEVLPFWQTKDQIEEHLNVSSESATFDDQEVGVEITGIEKHSEQNTTENQEEAIMHGTIPVGHHDDTGALHHDLSNSMMTDGNCSAQINEPFQMQAPEHGEHRQNPANVLVDPVASFECRSNSESLESTEVVNGKVPCSFLSVVPTTETNQIETLVERKIPDVSVIDGHEQVQGSSRVLNPSPSMGPYNDQFGPPIPDGQRLGAPQGSSQSPVNSVLSNVPLQSVLLPSTEHTAAPASVGSVTEPRGDIQVSVQHTRGSARNQDVHITVQGGMPTQVAWQSMPNHVEPHNELHEGRTFDAVHQDSIMQEQNTALAQPFLIHARLPAQGLHPDPLQNELLRIRKEEESIVQIREEAKLRLKAECENEIAELRKKYELLLKDADAVFLAKKKMLDVIYNKVLMNRVLAEEFRSKFSDSKAMTAKAGVPQGRNSHVTQLQIPSSQFAHRTIPAPFSAGIPITASSPAGPSLPHFHSALPASQASNEASAPGQSFGSAQLPIQMANSSSALRLSNVISSSASIRSVQVVPPAESAQRIVPAPSAADVPLSPTPANFSVPIRDTSLPISEAFNDGSESAPMTGSLQIPNQSVEHSSSIISTSVVSAPVLTSVLVQPVQVVHHSSALFSSIPGIPRSNTVIPQGHSQHSSTYRAPAPHLQRFRPSPSAGPPGLPVQIGGMPFQQQHYRNPSLPTMSAALQVHGTQSCLPTLDGNRRAQQLECHTPSLPIFLSTYDTSNQLSSDTGGNHTVVSEASKLTCLPVLASTFDSGSTAFEGTGPLTADSDIASANTMVDIVSLIDDDD